MPKSKAKPAILPGDVVQVTDGSPLLGALLIVEEVRPRFVSASAMTLRDGKPRWLYERLKPGTFVLIGPARMLKPEVARARRLAIETAQLVAAEGKTK